MGGDCKRKSHIHPATVSFHRCIQEFFYLGKCNNLVEFGLDLSAAHPEDRTVQINVLPSGQFGVKAGTNFKQASYASSDPDSTFRWFRDPAQNLQQGGLPRAISSDDTDHVPLLHFKRHVFEGPEILNRIL